MKVTYFGHSCFFIESGDSKIIIDPFYDQNLFHPIPTHVIVTHAHSDHIGHSVDLCKKHNAKLVATFEVGNYLSSQGVEDVHPMHVGAFVKFDDIKVKFVQAIHGSSDGINNIGIAAGVVINIEDRNIYHAGDTALFGDMALIAKRTPIDIAFLPIGGNFTMDVDDAVYAVTELIKPEMAVPMHYNTFPVIEEDPQNFAEQLKDSKTISLIFGIGESKDL